MSGRSYVAAIPAAVLDYRAKQRAVPRLPAPIAWGLGELRLAWRRRVARRRLARSIAHLDDRLLTDIGLGPEHLGFADRLVRGGAAGTDWQ
jgi:uncharacterized protein YjiS (DUF1127 family)